MNFSSITVAFLLSGVQLVDASGKFFILRSKMNGQCCSHAGLEKVLFKDCDLTNLDETVLWQDQVATTTATGVEGTGTLDTGLILTYDGTLYIVPKNGIQQLKKTAAAKAKKASWSYNGSQLYFANKDWTFSYKKPSKTVGMSMEKVILNKNGEYENSLIEKIYVIS